MRIYSNTLQEECKVYAIAMLQKPDELKNNVIFFIADKKTKGLCAESLENSQIIDRNLDMKYKYFYDDIKNVSIIVWDFFKDLDHFNRVMDFEEDYISEFEEARVDYKSGLR